MAELTKEQKAIVQEKADAYQRLVIDTAAAEAQAAQTWESIEDALRAAGKEGLIEAWNTKQAIAAELKKQRNAAKPELVEVVEQIAKELGVIGGKGRVVNEHVDIKHATYVSFPSDRYSQMSALNWLVERGWGSVISISLPNNTIKLPGDAPKTDDWKKERHLPVNAFGIPLMEVDQQMLKAYVDGDDKWLPQEEPVAESEEE